MEREREVEIECVQNDRNVFMSRNRERESVERWRECVCESEERHERTATG